MEGFYIDNSFRIDHFSFGSKANFNSISKSFPNTDIKHPLDKFKRDVQYSDVKIMRQGVISSEKRA